MVLRSAVPDVLPDTAPAPLVLIAPGVLDPLLDDALSQYRRACDGSRRGEPYLPRCWALLLGQMDQGALRVQALRWAGNVRESDEAVLEEFAEVIVPCFGSSYTNGRRGYWCDPAELLKIIREAEAQGLDVLGSVHMHADMHRFWPEHANGQLLSHRPTAMDEYLFRNGGWPLNMICHLESFGDDVALSVGAWAPPVFEDENGRATAMEVRLSLGSSSVPVESRRPE
ncbi:hypothetical protein ABZ470_24615 [Streptosporangium sp. NPDC020072]|uniref:hypothetical protein n=1 Tax=unclassified Streptosporangium TaxID=2632669 RepID=UPI003425C020